MASQWMLDVGVENKFGINIKYWHKFSMVVARVGTNAFSQQSL